MFEPVLTSAMLDLRKGYLEPASAWIGDTGRGQNRG